MKQFSMLKKKAESLLETGSVQAVLGLCETEMGALPHFFQEPQAMARAVPGPKWPLAKIALRIAKALPEANRMALLCRTCDARAIAELEKMNQLSPWRIECLVFDCTEEQAARCSCPQPSLDATAKPPLAALSPELQRMVTAPNKVELWADVLQKCIKCFGCRNICPVCFCPDCRLEDPHFVPIDEYPPSPLPWHLLRALHVADSCVGCGACQDACPSGIPLLAIHASLSQYLLETYNYRAGTSAPSPLHEADKKEGPCGIESPVWKDFFPIG